MKKITFTETIYIQHEFTGEVEVSDELYEEIKNNEGDTAYIKELIYNQKVKNENEDIDYDLTDYEDFEISVEDLNDYNADYEIEKEIYPWESV